MPVEIDRGVGGCAAMVVDVYYLILYVVLLCTMDVLLGGVA